MASASCHTPSYLTDLMQTIVQVLRERELKDPKIILDQLKLTKNILVMRASESLSVSFAKLWNEFEETIKQTLMEIMRLVDMVSPRILMHALEKCINNCDSEEDKLLLVVEFMSECIMALQEDSNVSSGLELAKATLNDMLAKPLPSHFEINRKMHKTRATLFERPSPKVISFKKPSFGPVFKEDQIFDEFKEDGLTYVKAADLGSFDGCIKFMYNATCKARNYYPDHADIPDKEFNQMLLKDGNFFLQGAFRYKGIQFLCYPKGHPIWGDDADMNTLRRWTESMFVFRNQIPLCVLENLICHPFFQDAIRNNKQLTKQLKKLLKEKHGLLMKVICELLLAPAYEPIMNATSFSEQPDLLCGLYSMMVTGSSRHNLIVTDQQVITLENAVAFKSAKELCKAGIRFEGVYGMGIRDIKFEEHTGRRGVFKLPLLIIDESTLVLFKSLIAYEEEALGLNDVRSNIRLLTELVPTIEDVNFLKDKKVIEGDTHKLLSILEELACKEMKLTNMIYDVKLKIDHYRHPLKLKAKRASEYAAKIAPIAAPVFSVLAAALT